MRTTKDQRTWLSRNWTPSNTTFRSWVAGSTKAHSIVSHLNDDVEDLVEKLEDCVETMAGFYDEDSIDVSAYVNASLLLMELRGAK